MLLYVCMCVSMCVKIFCTPEKSFFDNNVAKVALTIFSINAPKRCTINIGGIPSYFALLITHSFRFL